MSMTQTASPVESTAMILKLADATATLALVGGKGANLARLARAGFPVPDGFLITTAAYRAFVTANGLHAWILETVAKTKTDDPAALALASEQIRTRFASGAMPPALAEALAAAYEALGKPAVAVRSSATAEDLPDLSFAGQQDTYLNIVGTEALLQAVVDCWSSLWTARAIGYRSRNQIAHTDVALAVVVQTMVESECSGVLFTANPLTGKRTESVIDATLGLGEALVSGLVEPDQYVVETSSQRILSKTLGAKALTIRPQAGGGTVTLHDNSGEQQALPDAAIQALTALGARVAELYGSPQDIEWAWAQDKLYLLQARPITSLYPLPAGVGETPLELFFSFAAVQGVLDPLTPLGRNGLTAAFACGVGRAFGFNPTLTSQRVLYAAGERLWLRITPLLGNKIGRILVHNFPRLADPAIHQSIMQLLEEPAWSATGWPQPTTIRHIAHLLRRALPLIVSSLRRPEQNRQQVQYQLEAAVQQFATQAAAATTLADQLTLLEEELPRTVSAIFPAILARVLPGLLMLNRILAIANQTWAGNEAQQQRAIEITRGLPHNVTTEMDLALWATTQQIRHDPASLAHLQRHDVATLTEHYRAGTLPAVAKSALADFLGRYGMRGVAEIDLGRTRWREHPAQIFQTVQSYLRIDDPAQAPDAIFRRGEAAAQTVIDELLDTLRRQPGGARKAQVVRWMARRFRALAGLRETPKFFVIRLFGILRQGLLQSGAALVQQGVFTQPDDLFFLHVAELRGLAAGYAIDWKALVAERRAIYAREQLRRQVPRLILSDGRAIYGGAQAANAGQAGVLTGTPVSPGVVEGVVHVVFDPHTTQLAPGEILVCPGTDPAWTPLFLAAGALVMEVGGLMTHGSVVAREYGIPAVVGVHEATTRLQTGQRVRVDGSSGEITLLDEA
jgi:phosphoenolpyruvate synthase/pyruvate phosphate dikinase